MADDVTTQILLKIASDVQGIRDMLAALASATAETKKSADAIENFGQKAKEAGEHGTRMGVSIAEGAVAFGAAFQLGSIGVEAISEKIKDAVGATSQLVEQMRQVTQRTGLSGEAIQVFSRGARVDIGELESKVQRLQQTIGMALLNPEHAGAFQKMGLDPEQLKGKEIQEQLELIATGMEHVKDKNEQMAIATQLFGRGSNVMLGLLAKLRGPEGYAGLRAEVERTAGILGPEMAAALDAANHGSEEAMNKLSVGLAPVNLRMAEFKRTMNETLAAHAELLGQLGQAAAWSGVATGIGSALNIVNWGKFGSKFGNIFGAGFALALGVLIINELEKLELEAIDRLDKKLSALDRTKALTRQVTSAKDPEEANAGIAAAKAERDAQMQRARELFKDKQRSMSMGGDLTPQSNQELVQLEQSIKALDTLIAKKKDSAAVDAQGRLVAAAENQEHQDAAEWGERYLAKIKETTVEHQKMLILEKAESGTDEEKYAALEEVKRLTEGEFNLLRAKASLILDETERKNVLAGVQEKEEDALRAYIKLQDAQNAKQTQEYESRVAKQYADAQEMQRRQEQVAVAAIKQNQYMTERQKQAALLVIYKKEELDIDNEIIAAQHKYDTAGADTVGKTAAEAELRKLKDRKAQIPNDIQANTPQTVFQETQAGLVKLQNNFLTVGQSISSAMGSAISGLSNGITGLVSRTMDWKSALLSVTGAIGTSLLQSFSTMVSQWVVSHLVMDQARKLFHLKGAAEQTAATGTEVGIHAGGEAAKTGATAAGAEVRTGFRLGETVQHGIMVAWQTATHIAGEIAKTVATIAQGAIRIGVFIAEALASVFKAGVAALDKFPVPFVGPLLGIAAMAAIIGAGLGIVGKIKKGFYDGGYTGDGPVHQVAGDVHKGEIVWSQRNIAAAGGVAAVERMRLAGGVSSAGAGLSGRTGAGASRPVVGNGGGGPAVHQAFFNTSQSAENWLKSQSGRRVMTDFLRQQSSEL